MVGRENSKKTVKKSVKSNYLGILDRCDASRLIDRLAFLGFISKESRTINYESIKDEIGNHNKRVKEKYREYSYFTYDEYDKRTYDKVFKLLFDIKNGIYDGSYACKRKTIECLFAIAFYKYDVVALVETRWICGIEVKPLDRAARADLLYSGSWLDGGQMLNIINSLHSRVRSLLVTNVLAFTYLYPFIEDTFSLERLYIVMPEASDSSLLWQIAEQKKLDLSELKLRYQQYKESVQELVDNFANTIDIQVITTKNMFEFNNSLIVSNVNPSTYDFGSCISTTAMEAFYQKECFCEIGNNDNENIANLVKDIFDNWQFS